MRRLIVVAALLIASGPAMGQTTATGNTTPSSRPIIAGGGAMGLTISSLPAWPEDPIFPGGSYGANSGSVTLVGPSVGLGVGGQAGRLGDLPIFVEWSGSATLGQGASSSSRTLSDGDSLLITSGSATTGTVTLNTSTGSLPVTASGTANVTDSTGATANAFQSSSSPAGGSTALYAVTRSTTGAAFTAVTTDGTAQKASAFGFVADDRGYSLIGIGDLGNTTVTSSYNESAALVTQRVLLSTMVPLNDTWILQPRIGPVYNFLGRSVDRKTLVDIDPGSAFTGTIPQIGLRHHDVLHGNYLGAVAGAAVSGPLTHDWSVLLGADVGAAAYWADYRGTSAAIVPAGADIDLPVNTQSINGATGLGRVRGELSYAAPSGVVLTIGLQAEYIGNAPYLQTAGVNAPNATLGASSGSLTGSGETYSRTSIGTQGMWSFGASVALTSRF